MFNNTFVALVILSTHITSYNIDKELINVNDTDKDKQSTTLFRILQ